MEKDERKKKVDWWRWKHSCPKCGAHNISWNNVYRRKWYHDKGKWELKEEQQRECDSCHHQWWM